MLRVEDCRPGTPVECIDDGPSRWPGHVHDLRHGAVYTIRRAGRCAGPDGVWDIGVELVEHPREGWSFDRDRFRLLPEGRLAVFRKMLAPVKVGA